jgi:Fe-S-cluster containining protein
VRALRERLVEQVRLVGPLSDAERWAARIPCALLDGEGRCSIHAARPLRCRAFHSCSVEPCREAFEGKGDPAPVKSPLLARAQDAAEEGYDRALIAAGLSAAGERLEGGLLALLAQLERS